jgi:hypothetical protein
VRIILIVSIIVIACVTTVTIVLNREPPTSVDISLPHVKTGNVTAKVGLTKWYVINRLSARWVKKEKREGEPNDVYEVTGQVRKKYQEVPDVATIIVKPYVGFLNVSTKSQVLRDVALGEGKKFTVEVVDPTQARDRGENVKIIVSAHPNEE